MQATTAKQVHELFVERFNALDADGIMALYEPNAGTNLCCSSVCLSAEREPETNPFTGEKSWHLK